MKTSKKTATQTNLMAQENKPESERAAAARLTIEVGSLITRAMVRHWKKKGLDLHDIPELCRQLRNQERVPLFARKSAAIAEPQTITVAIEDILKIITERDEDFWAYMLDTVPKNFVGLTEKEMRETLLVGRELHRERWSRSAKGHLKKPTKMR